MKSQPEPLRVLILCSLGGALEFFDFIIFALMAKQLAIIFFPNQNEFNALLTTFSTFAIGYMARPLGGIILGHFGDRYGRKQTFTFSILLMACSTFAIGLLPTYAHIGVFAPLLLVFFRLLQGLSIGGEIPGAITYTSEYWPEKKGLCIGVIFFCLQSGIAFGFLMHSLIITHLATHDVLQWGWRLPFFLGGLFGCIAYFLRKKLLETPTFIPFITKETHFPLLYLLKHYKGKIVIGSLFMACAGLPLTLLFILLPTYLQTTLTVSNENLNTQALAMLSTAFCSLIIGISSDKFSRIKLGYLFSIAGLFLSIPIFYIYITHIHWIIIAYSLSAIFVGLGLGNLPSLLPDLFPPKIRYSAIGLSYNLGIGVVTGLAPLLLITGIHTFHTPYFPAYLLIANSVLMLLTMHYFIKVQVQHNPPSH